jgi:hypothetical protein
MPSAQFGPGARVVKIVAGRPCQTSARPAVALIAASVAAVSAEMPP